MSTSESEAAESAPADALPLPAPNAPEPMSMGAVLRVGPLRRLWYAQIVSTFGDFIALFAVITAMTFKLHADAQQITGVQIAYMLPIALLGIVSGVFVDRWPLKQTMVASDLLRAGLCLLLITVHSVWGFYVVLAAVSIVSSVFTPAQGVAVRSTVPLHGIRSAQALMQQVMFVMRIVGGPLATTLVTVLGYNACYAIDAVSFVGSACLIASVALKTEARSAVVETVRGKSAVVVGPDAKQKSGVAKVLEDMKQGTSFIVHHAGLLFVITAMGAAMFVMGCFAPLIAVYVRDILHASKGTFGVTSAMIGVGLMTGINLLTAAAKKVKNSLLIYAGLLGISGGTALLAAVPHLPAALVGLFVIGFGVGGIIVPSQTLIQQETPQHMLGRVGSTVMSLIFSAQIAGLVLSGVLTNHMSVRAVFGVCAGTVLVLLVAGKVWMEPKEKEVR